MKTPRPLGQSIGMGTEVPNLHGVRAPEQITKPNLAVTFAEAMERKGIALEESPAGAAHEAPVVDVPDSDIGELREVPISQIKGGKYQPRRIISEEALNELALSISANGGLNNPVVVRPAKDGGYEIIGGHRRYQATRDILKKDKLLVRVRDVSEREAAILACVDNRSEAPSDYENGMYYRRLMDDGIFDSITALATHVGIARSEASRCLAYGDLPSEVHAFLDQDVHLIGATGAAGLASLAKDGYPEVVIRAVERVHQGELTQAQALSWARRAVEEIQAGQGSLETALSRTEEAKPPASTAPKETIEVAGRRIATSEVKGKGKRLVFEFEDAAEAARFYEMFKASLMASSEA